MRKTGKDYQLGNVKYFIPFPLPPSNPDLAMSQEMLSLYGEASFALGQLNEMSIRVPDPTRFVKGYAIKEAMLSSAIEGIHTTLMEVYTYDLNKPKKSTKLVVNYTKAMEVALQAIQEDNMPIVARVILDAHKALLSESEEDNKLPGEYRQQSVRVGFHIPPPANEVSGLMSELEKYINEPSGMPALIRIGLVHAQFEIIHPFLDGNGRMGRLLITLMLIDNNLLTLPILYISHYFKKHRQEYYQHLDRISKHGDFEGWIVFYLKAIRDSAIDAYTRAKDIEKLEQDLKAKIASGDQFHKIRDNSLRVLRALFSHPVTDVSEVSQHLGKSYNTISNIFTLFVDNKLLAVSADKRNKVYSFKRYLDLLEKEYID